MLLSQGEEIDEIRIGKGITISMSCCIFKSYYDIPRNEHCRTEKGNLLIHVESAFSSKLQSQIDKNNMHQYYNFNRWNPLFMAMFHNNNDMIKYYTDMQFYQNEVDYFGNEPSFYKRSSLK